MNGTKQIAQRIVNAENAFISSVTEQFGFTKEEAEKILTTYKKVKAVKIDPIVGQYKLTHGDFWSKTVMEKAINF